MEYNETDTATLTICYGRTFSSTGHYPLLAGHTATGIPLYYAKFAGGVAVPEGVQAGGVKVKIHNTGGSTRLIEGHLKFIHVPALRYDPYSYKLSGYNSFRGKEAGGMDATGPFSWKFHRKLPVTRPSERISPDEASLSLPEEIWRELLIEPGEGRHAAIGDSASSLTSDRDNGNLGIQQRKVRNEGRITARLDRTLSYLQSGGK